VPQSLYTDPFVRWHVGQSSDPAGLRAVLSYTAHGGHSIEHRGVPAPEVDGPEVLRRLGFQPGEISDALSWEDAQQRMKNAGQGW